MGIQYKDQRDDVVAKVVVMAHLSINLMVIAKIWLTQDEDDLTNRWMAQRAHPGFARHAYG